MSEYDLDEAARAQARERADRKREEAERLRQEALALDAAAATIERVWGLTSPTQ